MNLNVKTYHVCTLLGYLLLSTSLPGCGGASVETSKTTTTPITVPPISPATPSTPEETDPPQVDIVFPSSVARIATGDTIWVKGTAYDETGISEIKVNGVVAELIESDGLTRLSKSSKASKSASNNNIEWAVEIPVAQHIVVETSDTLGNLNSNAASTTLYSGEVPHVFYVDDVNQRLLGFNWWSDKLLNIDLNTGAESYITTSEILRAEDIVYVDKENLLAMVEYDFDGGAYIKTMDVESGTVNQIANYKLPDIIENLLFFHVKQIDYLPSENSVYINFLLFSETDTNQNHIVRYDFNSQSFTSIVNGQTEAGDILSTDNMVISDSGIYFTNYHNIAAYSQHEAGLQRLTFDGSETSPVSDVVPQVLTINSQNQNLLYGISAEDIISINVTSGEVTSVSPQTPDTELNLSQIRMADFDATNNRLLVLDEFLDMVMAVDLETGARSRVIHNGVGNGKAIIMPRHIEHDHTNNILYVADDGDIAPESLIAVDLDNGDRRQIGDINQSSNQYIADLVLDKIRDQLFVVYRDKILRLNLLTEETETFFEMSSVSEQAPAQIEAVELDQERARLLFNDSVSDALFSLDINDGSLSLVSTATKNNFVYDLDSSPVEFTINETTDQVLMFNRQNGVTSLQTIDLETGERALVQNICSDQPAFEWEMESVSLVRLFMETERDLILTGHSGIFRYNLATNQCQTLSANQRLIMLDVLKTSKNQWLYSTQSGIYQLDISSGQSVIISK